MGLRSAIIQMRKQMVFETYADSKRKIDAFRLEQQSSYLRKLLSYVVKHVEYYRELLPPDTDWIRSFSSIPTLTKNLIRKNFDRLKSDELQNMKWVVNTSGGSTGEPVTFIQDWQFREWSNLTQRYYSKKILGVEYAEIPKIILWGSERDIFGARESFTARARHWLTQTTFVNSFRMDETCLKETTRLINNKKPVMIKGYAGSLYQLAKYVRDHNLKIHHPRMVYSAAETLRPFMRELIESTFECKVYNFYGSREVGPIAAECRKGRMHLFCFNNYIEVVDSQNQPIHSGQEGRVLVTVLHNTAMPLVRYDIGDTAIVGDQCTCGLDLPTLKEITGRVTDHFKTQNGTLIHGEYFTHLFYYKPWVKEFQVVQKDFSNIEIYFVPIGELPFEDQKDLENKIRLVMGNDCLIDWHIVETIPRTPQGKLLFTRSLIS